MTSIITLAGVTAEAHHRFNMLADICRDYMTDNRPEFTLNITDQDIQEERSAGSDGFSPAYLETLAFYRQFCSRVADRGIILFHSVAMEYDGKAYLFTAPSGTGKSTHARLWLESFGDRVSILNGDKPLIDTRPSVPMVYGTPYMGKENQGHPGAVPLAGICFLHRSPTNGIAPMSVMDAFQQGFVQVFMPADAEAGRNVLTSLTGLIGSVPCWSLGCNISAEAARLSFTTMTGGKV